MALRLSFDEVAKALKLSRTAYWQIEKGGDPMLTTALRIAAFYGKPVTELWWKPKGKQ
jgi:DNA-binding XRE family transcriptional regulator